jgi:hypothetical protein
LTTEEKRDCGCLPRRILTPNADGSLTGHDANEQCKYPALLVAYSRNEDDIQQTLGKVLGYPWYKDDLENFPGATEADGVCVGEHVSASIAAEAAKVITALRKRVEELEKTK